MWYRKRIAINDDTGEQFSVVMNLLDEDTRLYPSMFFAYFSTAPVHTAITQCLDILDLKKFIQNDGNSKEDEEILETLLC